MPGTGILLCIITIYIEEIHLGDYLVPFYHDFCPPAVYSYNTGKYLHPGNYLVVDKNWGKNPKSSQKLLFLG